MTTRPENQQYITLERYSAIHFMVMYVVATFFDGYDTYYRLSRIRKSEYSSRDRALAIRNRALAVVKYDRYYDDVELMYSGREAEVKYVRLAKDEQQ